MCSTTFPSSLSSTESRSAARRWWFEMAVWIMPMWSRTCEWTRSVRARCSLVSRLMPASTDEFAATTSSKEAMRLHVSSNFPCASLCAATSSPRTVEARVPTAAPKASCCASVARVSFSSSALTSPRTALVSWSRWASWASRRAVTDATVSARRISSLARRVSLLSLISVRKSSCASSASAFISLSCSCTELSKESFTCLACMRADDSRSLASSASSFALFSIARWFFQGEFASDMCRLRFGLEGDDGRFSVLSFSTRVADRGVFVADRWAAREESELYSWSLRALADSNWAFRALITASTSRTGVF
mmetsp:Transcript_39573/g.79922  ORF Transcript_39573/g.79922 Transcript_39573/m.79922 type:complete len:307 (+) Transcript_39573:485-1405(+)